VQLSQKSHAVNCRSQINERIRQKRLPGDEDSRDLLSQAKKEGIGSLGGMKNSLGGMLGGKWGVLVRLFKKNWEQELNLRPGWSWTEGRPPCALDPAKQARVLTLAKAASVLGETWGGGLGCSAEQPPTADSIPAEDSAEMLLSPFWWADMKQRHSQVSG
jgi:hypothetical protein